MRILRSVVGGIRWLGSYPESLLGSLFRDILGEAPAVILKHLLWHSEGRNSELSCRHEDQEQSGTEGFLCLLPRPSPFPNSDKVQRRLSPHAATQHHICFDFFKFSRCSKPKVVRYLASEYWLSAICKIHESSLLVHCIFAEGLGCYHLTAKI